MGTVLCTQRGPVAAKGSVSVADGRAFTRTFRDHTPDGAPSHLMSGSGTSVSRSESASIDGGRLVSSSDVRIESLDKDAPSDDEGYLSEASVSQRARTMPQSRSPQQQESGIRRMPLSQEEVDFSASDSALRRRSWPLVSAAPEPSSRSGLDAKVLADFESELVRVVTPCLVRKGEVFVQPGGDDVASEMYLIKHGTAFVCSPDGLIVYATLEPGAFFGEHGVILPIVFSYPEGAVVHAGSHMFLHVVQRAKLEELFAKYPPIGDRFHEVMDARRKAPASSAPAGMKRSNRRRWSIAATRSSRPVLYSIREVVHETVQEDIYRNRRERFSLPALGVTLAESQQLEAAQRDKDEPAPRQRSRSVQYDSLPSIATPAAGLIDRSSVQRNPEAFLKSFTGEATIYNASLPSLSRKSS